MKKLILVFLTVAVLQVHGIAQDKNNTGNFGNTLNVGLGLGLGINGYYPYPLPTIHFDYELNVAKSFTLAPFIDFYFYRDNYYHETIVPIGVKGSVYLNNLLKTGPIWDFYLAGSMGLAIKHTVWVNGYTKDTWGYRGPSDLSLGYHIVTEYHMTRKLGVFIDLSNGISTFGLAVHH